MHADEGDTGGSGEEGTAVFVKRNKRTGGTSTAAMNNSMNTSKRGQLPQGTVLIETSKVSTNKRTASTGRQGFTNG